MVQRWLIMVKQYGSASSITEADRLYNYRAYSAESAYSMHSAANSKLLTGISVTRWRFPTIEPLFNHMVNLVGNRHLVSRHRNAS